MAGSELVAPPTTSGNKYDINDALLDGLDLAAWVVPQIGPQGESAAHGWPTTGNACRIGPGMVARWIGFWMPSTGKEPRPGTGCAGACECPRSPLWW